ncbi:hypothetical protein APR04_001746 [Promicromonospora umidemergens]|uniref:Uncharacterized protein n=1 Tax=Promicromonospora umidemergens TaxID=629679 RepID=A0ABP8XI03_9MICO|nr:hypothetical protein [Promicromonospora umidemergens]MCP2282843.1 hypothetical protein [Promicromonospora umidemergens]
MKPTTSTHTPTAAELRRAMGAGDPAALADAWQVGRHLWPVLRALGYDSGYLGGRGANSDALAGRAPHLRRAGAPPGYLAFVAVIPQVSGHDRIRLHHQGADLPRLPEHRGQLGVVLQDVPFRQSRSTPHKAQALADYGTKVLTEGVILSARGGISVSLVHPQVLDSPDPRGRKALARHADLVGALRLPPRPSPDGPGMPFDVVLLRRRPTGARGTGHPFTDVSTIQLGERHATINEYFATHPEHVLSRVLPGPDSSTRLVPVTDRTRLGQRMQEAFMRIGGAATQRGLTAPGFLRPPTPDHPQTSDTPRPIDQGVRPGASDDLHL